MTNTPDTELADLRKVGRRCGIDGCEKPHLAKGLCSMHRDRAIRLGSPLASLKQPHAPKGEPLRWIAAHKSFAGDECLIWPFGRYPSGYGKVTLNRRPHTASRVMCESIHGPAPSPQHQAAHSCGRGHRSCMHPGHLRWATPAENTADKQLHGTIPRGEQNKKSILTVEQVRHIRSLRGTAPLREIGGAFGVSAGTVSSIYSGKNWRHVT